MGVLEVTCNIIQTIKSNIDHDTCLNQEDCRQLHVQPDYYTLV
jgi:hypothetical protein